MSLRAHAKFCRMAGNGAPVRNQDSSRVDFSDATSMHFKRAERSDGKKMSGKKMSGKKMAFL
jgi:hypothetical protein